MFSTRESSSTICAKVLGGDAASLQAELAYQIGEQAPYVPTVVSRGDLLFLLGDAVECPLQVAEDEFHAFSDVDAAQARRTREAMWRELEGTDAQVGAAHFPGLTFGRVMRGEGRRYWSPVS